MKEITLKNGKKIKMFNYITIDYDSGYAYNNNINEINKYAQSNSCYTRETPRGYHLIVNGVSLGLTDRANLGDDEKRNGMDFYRHDIEGTLFGIKFMTRGKHTTVFSNYGPWEKFKKTKKIYTGVKGYKKVVKGKPRYIKPYKRKLRKTKYIKVKGYYKTITRKIEIKEKIYVRSHKRRRKR